MSKILTFILITINFNLFSQVFYDKQNQDFFINYDSKQLNLKYKETIINGTFEEVRGSDFYTYLVANGGNVHLVMKKLTDYKFYGVDILKGEYKDVLKGFKRDRKYGSKVEIIYSSLPSLSSQDDFDLMSEKHF